MPKVKCICQKCGKEFFVYPSYIKNGIGKYCSNKCRRNKVKCVCRACKKEFYVQAYRIKRGCKYCSRSCMNKDQVPWSKGKHPSIETRKKISAALKGKHHSAKSRRKISEARKGQPSPMKGRKHTAESRRKMSKISLGPNNPRWQGGRVINRGYVLIYNPQHPSCNRLRYVREHRLVLEKILGRYLKPGEISHHVNGDKTDNRPENLMLFTSNSVHRRWHRNPENVKPKEIIFDGRHI